MICSVKKTKKGSKSLCRIKISFYELKTRIAGTASSTLVQGFSWMSLYFVLVLMAPLQARQSVFFKALFQHKAFHLHSAVQWRMQRCPKYFSSCITFQATCNRCDYSGFVFSLGSLFPVRKVRTHPMCVLTHTHKYPVFREDLSSWWCSRKMKCRGSGVLWEDLERVKGCCPGSERFRKKY